MVLQWQEKRIDQRHVPASLWPGLEQELSAELGHEPVSRSSMISTVLVGSMGALMRVMFLESRPASIASLEDADRMLGTLEAVSVGRPA